MRSEHRRSPLGSRLEGLLATLPEPQRAALVLRYQEDLTPEEIAATLEAPLATVKSHLQRGLKLLRAKARGQFEGVRTSQEVRRRSRCVEFEPMDDFEQELRQAFERRPAPPA